MAGWRGIIGVWPALLVCGGSFAAVQFLVANYLGPTLVDVAVLRLIADRPATRAPDLAASLGRETARFKADVRKLKELGLTESLEVGYRLSPRGRAYYG